MNTETAAPRLIGKLALESVLPKDEVLAWLKAAALADPHGTPTQASFTNLEKFPFVACLAYPLEEAQTTPDRLLLPLSPDGYGHGSFLRAVDSIQVHLGGPRSLSEGSASAMAAAAAAQLGWADFKPKALNVQKKQPRAKRKKFNSGDKARADLAIYLTLLKAIGAPLPSAEKIEGTPICELLTELHAFVIATCPRRLIHLVSNGRNGAIANYVKKFRAAYPCTKIKWAGDQMLDNDDRSDNSAYRNLLADIYHCLIKANGGKTNWLWLFDPDKAGIVTWLNDKIKLVALPQISAPRQGCRIYTPDHAALDAIENAATLFPDSARAFGAPSFTPDEEAQAAGLATIRRLLGRMPELPMKKRRELFNGIEGLIEDYQFDSEQRAELEPELAVAREQHLGIETVSQAAGLAMIRRYLGRLPQLPMKKRRELFNGIEELIEDYQFDSEQRAELEPELVVAREQHLGIEAVGEGSANFTPTNGFSSRTVQRAVKAKVQALRAQGLPDYCQLAPENWLDLDPYAAPIQSTVLPDESAIEANLPEPVEEAAAVEVAAVEAAQPLPPLFDQYWAQFSRPAKRPRRQKRIEPGQLCFATEWAKPTSNPTPTPPTSLPKAPVPPLALGLLVAAFNQRSDRRYQRQAAGTREALSAPACPQSLLKVPDPPRRQRIRSLPSPARLVAFGRLDARPPPLLLSQLH